MRSGFRYCTIPSFHEDKFRCERYLEFGVDYYDALYEFKTKADVQMPYQDFPTRDYMEIEDYIHHKPIPSTYKSQTATCNNLSNILKHFSTKQP